jgi:hypothetical protein
VRTREVLKNSQDCHTYNCTAQHPVEKRPAVHSHQETQMKNNISGWARQIVQNTIPFSVDTVISLSYNIITYFTGGPKENRK